MRRGSVVGLVEDSDDDHAAFARLAAQEAPDVTVVRWPSAEALLDALREGHADDLPDVLVLDLHLPGMDGADLVRQLRRGATTRALPAFILSGSERQADVDRCYAAGASAFLSKPGTTGELRALVRMLFRAMTTFRVPSRAPDGHAAADQSVIDAERERYEEELLRERAGRTRAEALQRLTLRLANASDPQGVERLLVAALTAGRKDTFVEVLGVARDGRTKAPTGAGAPEPESVLLLPLITQLGTHHGVLRVESPATLSDEDEAQVHGAVSAAVQALTRIDRVAELARRAEVAVADLPLGRWWREAVDEALGVARRSGRPLSLAVVLPALVGAGTGGAQATSPVKVDAQLLAIIDAWRAHGHDLLSPSGDERWVAIVDDHASAVETLAVTIARALGNRAPFTWAAAEWDRREDGEALLLRAMTALARAPWVPADPA
ncbi:MAG: response regulator [Solirubrobacteraceae bacterium]|nr:response regulator [Solirubrobacteraceae bacterium]